MLSPSNVVPTTTTVLPRLQYNLPELLILHTQAYQNAPQTKVLLRSGLPFAGGKLAPLRSDTSRQISPMQVGSASLLSPIIRITADTSILAACVFLLGFCRLLLVLTGNQDVLTLFSLAEA